MATDTAKSEPKQKVSIPTFFRQVRQEARKITWTSRKETITATIMVLVFATVAALFFFLADLVIRNLIRLILNLPDFFS